MGNWKELGEVPDSDDEGWDSEDYLQPLSTTHSLPKVQTDPRSDDLWEFQASPTSSPVASLTITTSQLLAAQPQHPVSANSGKDTGQLLNGKQRDLATAVDLQHRSDTPRPDYDSLDLLTDVSAEAKVETGGGANDSPPDQRDEVSPSIVQDIVVTDSHAEGDAVHLKALRNERKPGTISPTVSQRLVRGRRSLRPRKPIQEHPYLLENAQYSKAFKSHGLKPIRIAVAEQVAARQRSEDSQDQEFTEAESQSVGLDEESQRVRKKMKRIVLDDDLDELALSQSPRTSSPQRHLRASSEQSPGQQTDHTSIHGDEDFPDIRDLIANKKASKSTKRRTTPPSSTTRKRLKTKQAMSGPEPPLRTQNDAWDLPSSPEPEPSTSRWVHTLSPIDSTRPSFRTISRSTSPPGQLSPAPRPFNPVEPIDLTALTADSEEESDVQESGGLSSDSESDLIKRTGRRIRGVLPASWLRLDQQARKERASAAVRKPSPPRSPDQPRPGLATKKSGLSKPAVSTKSFLEDLDEDDGGDQDIQRIAERATRYVDQEQDVGQVGTFALDDNASVVEDNVVDWMLPDQKRNRPLSGGPPRKRKKTQREGFKGPKQYRQPKILGSVHRLDRLSDSAARSHQMKTNGLQVERAASPPALSIVDVVEPGAPKFIKIAARAATKRANMGRSQPSNKSIKFGNRADNIDALSVLKRWRTGGIKQRTPKVTQSSMQQKLAKSREPLRPVASNTTRPVQASSVVLSFNQPQKLSRQISMENFVSTEGTEVFSERQRGKKTRIRNNRLQPHDLNFGYRPAQLEADVPQGDDVVFGVRKRMLDLVFRKSRKEVLAPTFQLRQPSPDEETHPELSKPLPSATHSLAQLDRHEGSTTRKTQKSRKLIPPRRLDLDAPQYKHANDPLPFFDEHSSSPIEGELLPQNEEGSKIIGLGPFGTHYTQHFDRFPLHSDTFFHHTTIIGNGTLKNALGYRVPHAVTCDRPALCFKFSNYHFQWGRWVDTTSSELGLLFDSIAEHVESDGDAEASSGTHQAIDAAGFVLNYVFEFASVNEESDLTFFTQRMFELLRGFMNLALHSRPNQRTRHVLLQIMSRFLICALVLLRLCQGTADLSNQAQQAEDILEQLAKILIERLLSIGLSDIRTAYDDLQRPRFRERGIRDDNFTMITWAIVIKVLGSAQIPKAGFWELVSSVTTAKLSHVIDAPRLESLWRDMFTLLPLTEFDDAGVLSKGMRYTAPLQGWSLPQKLLKVVFEAYQTNQRQSPSFNDYCRALLGRCHYLIDQWGWQKCSGIVGTIFDFFGRHNLSHLRNEEVYKSPRFLEELSDGPCLLVEPEDRCFHIFLKILAVAIQGMKRRGLSNDIRNLITRCLPNHNRQYSKEQTIHSHDLASLRNHHDLLCTLFWAAPPEFRRPVALIEDLVRPASSHKEACLINLRAWSQLTRFVVSSGSSVQDYRPFMSWQNNVFHQVLNQYLSAAADVEHQFMSMAKEDRGKVQQQFLDSVVVANQNAAKDVLYFSVIASLDVMKRCTSLTAATFSFNISQTTKSFNRLSSKGTDLDWGLLRATFDTVDVFVSRLENLWCSFKESSGESVSTHTNREFEDAVEFLDDKVVQSFIAASRKAMLSPASDAAAQPARSVVEKAIILCGRIASLFIDGGKSSLLRYFSAGKYGLFEAVPGELGPMEWRFVPLFVATLLRNHVFSFSSIGCTHFDIWISSLVQPLHALRYEADLAETLKTLDVGYMKGAGTITRTALDYSKNRDLFAGAVIYMRREVRQAGFAQRKPTKAKYEKSLRSVMRQIRSALQSLKLNSTEHSNYISFIRDIVALIKSHGADICSIDPFFYQVSAEYSPPKEDPQLHTAGILAYGIRLGEGETTAIPQLFSYLYNHFKTSLASDSLDAERKIIEKGMKDDNVLVFVIGRMLPAIIQASSQSNDIWPLLVVYAEALSNSLTRSCLPREVPDGAVDDAVALLTVVLTWTQSICESSTELTPTQAHIFTQLIAVCNAIRPSLASWLLQSSAMTSRLRDCVAGVTRVAKRATAVLGELRVTGGSGIAIRNISVKELILTDIQLVPINFDSHVKGFTQSLIHDVKSNWVITLDNVTVRVAATPSTQRGMQVKQGVKNDLHIRIGILSKLLDELNIWVSEMGEEEKGSGQRRKRRGSRHVPARLAPGV